MTVGELIKRLRKFPPQFPVYLASENPGDRVASPLDVVMDLVHESTLETLPESDTRSAPDGFADSVVVYPYVIHEGD